MPARSADVAAFLSARDFLLAHRTDYATAYEQFEWPRLEGLNWALDYFDAMAVGNDRPALRIVRDDGSDRAYSFAELSRRSNQVANALRSLGARRGDRLLLMLPNVVETWETILACIKLGVVVVPATPQLTPRDLEDRFERGHIRHVVTDGDGAVKFATLPGDYTRMIVASDLPGWTRFETAHEMSAEFEPDGETSASDPMLLYFTSGTTAKPKLVLHTHASYPVGHLSTMYWIGLQAGDVHWTSAPRVGPSTRGAVCSRRGTPARRSSSTITSASTRSACSTPSCAAASRHSARRRLFGGC